MIKVSPTLQGVISRDDDQQVKKEAAFVRMNQSEVKYIVYIDDQQRKALA